MGKRKTLRGACVGRECERKGQGGEWEVMVAGLTFMPHVLVLLLSVMEGSPAWEGKGGNCVRGWAERSQNLHQAGSLRGSATCLDLLRRCRQWFEALRRGLPGRALRGSVWCSPGEAPECHLKEGCSREPLL